MDLMVIMGIVLVLMETIMVSTGCDGFYWWDVKSCWRNVQKHTTKRNFVKVLLEKDNGL